MGLLNMRGYSQEYGGLLIKNMNTKTKLLFVYNVDSSVFAQISDAFKKVIAPATYECNLCMVTYGVVSMKGEWKEFLDASTFEKEFLHKDEFHQRYPEFKGVKLPAVFIINTNVITLLISSEEINLQGDIAGLKKLINSKFKFYE
ncbi:MAG: hypothetical protein Greene07147_302 [Parcubacteria group bacterium Greene0714_7]|nr:MAG: hypothetical protein Greene07147_302 [Parcubacteria group bacterium Greene0714_7]